MDQEHRWKMRLMVSIHRSIADCALLWPSSVGRAQLVFVSSIGRNTDDFLEQHWEERSWSSRAALDGAQPIFSSSMERSTAAILKEQGRSTVFFSCRQDELMHLHWTWRELMIKTMGRGKRWKDKGNVRTVWSVEEETEGAIYKGIGAPTKRPKT